MPPFLMYQWTEVKWAEDMASDDSVNFINDVQRTQCLYLLSFMHVNFPTYIWKDSPILSN